MPARSLIEQVQIARLGDECHVFLGPDRLASRDARRGGTTAGNDMATR
jgi:hypothetical protein